MTAREIADIFAKIELCLIASLKRNLKRHKSEEADYGFSWPAWRRRSCEMLNGSVARIKRLYPNMLPSLMPMWKI